MQIYFFSTPTQRVVFSKFNIYRTFRAYRETLRSICMNANSTGFWSKSWLGLMCMIQAPLRTVFWTHRLIVSNSVVSYYVGLGVRYHNIIIYNIIYCYNLRLNSDQMKYRRVIPFVITIYTVYGSIRKYVYCIGNNIINYCK